jgi:hypothetical protein
MARHKLSEAEIWQAMGSNGRLFHLTDNTDDTTVDQVQQQTCLYLLKESYIFFDAITDKFLWQLHRFTVG